MIIENVEIVDDNGRPGLAVTIDKKEALFRSDLKNSILEKYNAVFLGNEFVDDYQVTIPEDRADRRHETVLKGFSDDPKIVELIRQWLRNVARG